MTAAIIVNLDSRCHHVQQVEYLLLIIFFLQVLLTIYVFTSTGGCHPPAETKVEFFFPQINAAQDSFYDISLVRAVYSFILC